MVPVTVFKTKNSKVLMEPTMALFYDFGFIQNKRPLVTNQNNIQTKISYRITLAKQHLYIIPSF